jgi:serine/threonine protein kinase
MFTSPALPGSQLHTPTGNPQDFDGYHFLNDAPRGGQMGVVFRAIKDGQDVAVKLLHADPEDRIVSRFCQEIIFLRYLPPHRHVVRYVGDGVTRDGKRYLAVEYLPGGTLHQRVGTTIEPDAIARLMQQIAEGLAHIHACTDQPHRDLKPTNILFRKDGTACIIDFGTVKQSEDSKLTGSHGKVGTTKYSSPEQLRNPRTVDKKTDVYSLGVILYELLTGRCPFEPEPNESEFQFQIRIARGDPLPPHVLRPDIPDALNDICLWCLEKDTECRYSSAKLCIALTRYLERRSLPMPDSPSYRNDCVTVGTMQLGVCLIIGGDGKTQYPYPHGIVASFRPDKFRVPEDVTVATTDMLEKRIQKMHENKTPFLDNDQIRIDDWGNGLAADPSEAPFPLRLATSVTNYFATQVTHVMIDQRLKDGQTIRQKYAGELIDFRQSHLANPLAVNLSVVTADRHIYIARRGNKTGVNEQGGLVPAVSGTGSPEFDTTLQGTYDPFNTAVREATQEMMGRYPLSREEITFFGLARVRSNFFPFLFGEARVKLTSEELEAQPRQDRFDVRHPVGRPFTIEDVTSWIAELFFQRDKQGQLSRISHTAIWSLYQSLIYEYPERWADIQQRLTVDV